MVLVLQMVILAEKHDVTMVLAPSLALQMRPLAEKSFATGYKRYEINSVTRKKINK